jgi:plasmid stabilization system protein ParE
MRSVEFHPEAAAEFLSAVRRAAERIVEYPNSGGPFGRRLRRVLIRGFPYGLIYRVERERLFVVSVMHLHRRPGYWQSRL